jgi:hypothetical protein
MVDRLFFFEFRPRFPNNIQAIQKLLLTRQVSRETGLQQFGALLFVIINPALFIIGEYHMLLRYQKVRFYQLSKY